MNDDETSIITTISNNDLIDAKRLLDLYLSRHSDKNYIKQLSTLLSTLSTTNFNFESFIQLRSKYFGTLTTHPNNNSNIDKFQIDLFYAALLTNSPAVIDNVMKCVTIRLEDLNIPSDDHMKIKQFNCVFVPNYTETFQPNMILFAIIEATQHGHYEAIKHLIEKYNLSPTIRICHYTIYQAFVTFTNLLYFAAHSKTPQIIEYLLPSCLSLTNPVLLQHIVFAITEGGHLDIVKQLKDRYNIDLLKINGFQGKNLLSRAMLSKNTDLIDYCIDIGFSFYNNNKIHISLIKSTIQGYQWDSIKHLVNKYNIAADTITNPTTNPLPRQLSYKYTTTETVDFIVDIFKINLLDDSLNTRLLLYKPALTGNLPVLKHLVEKYEIQPITAPATKETILHSILSPIYPPPSLEMLEYLYATGIDLNQANLHDKTAIEIPIGSSTDSADNECPVYIIKSLLEHNAVIHNVSNFVQTAFTHRHYNVVQYLCQDSIYQSQLDITTLQPTHEQISLLESVIPNQPSIQFIDYLLSNIVSKSNNIPQQQSNTYQYVLNKYMNVDIIKLMVKYNIPVMIDAKMFRVQIFPNVKALFDILDYFHDQFGFNIETYHNDLSQNDVTTPLLEYTSSNRFEFPLKSICRELHCTQVMIYCGLICRYKANVNDQIPYSKNTVFHHLATHNQLSLIQFTLQYSYQKPNIYIVNNLGETFLHVLLKNYDVKLQLDGDEVDQEEMYDLLGVNKDDVVQVLNQVDEDNGIIFQRLIDSIIAHL